MAMLINKLYNFRTKVYVIVGDDEFHRHSVEK